MPSEPGDYERFVEATRGRPLVLDSIWFRADELRLDGKRRV